MEENQIIVDIGLDAFIASLRNLQKQYELNTAALKAMKDAGEEQSDAYITLTQEQKVLRQQMASTEKSIQNEIKMQQAQEGSLVQLRAQLANLNKQYDSMSGIERMGKSGEELQTRIKALHDQILGLEGDTGRMQRNVGNYPEAMKPVTAQLREMTQELIRLRMEGKANTEEYQQLLQKTGQMKDAMLDAQNEVKQMASDTSTLNSVLAGAQAAAGAFSVALGVMNLVGDKDSETAKELAEAQRKLQSAIAITTGLQALQNALQKESALMMGVNKLRMLAAAAAQRAYAAATRDAEAAQVVFNKVAKSNIYVWLASVILTVVGAIAAFTRGSKEQEEQTEEVNEKLRTQIELLKQLNEQYQSLRSVATDEIDYQIQMAEATGANAETINQLKIAKLDYLQAALDADKRTAESAILQYSAVKDAYQDNLAQFNELIAKRAVLLAQGDKDGAEWVQKDIDRLQEQMDKQKELIDYVDNLTKRQYAINLERARISNETAKTIEENLKREREAMKRNLEEMKRNREELKQSTDELVSYFDKLKKWLKPVPEGEKDFFEQLREKYEAIDKAAQEAQERHELLRRYIQETQGFDIDAKMDDSIMEKLERQSNPLYDFAQSYKENAETIQETSSALESSFGSLASMYETMANDESKSEEEREEAARKAKAWAKVQIATNAATAVAKGVASAVDVGFPAAIPAMATMLAAILSAIAQAKSLAAESHEHGGVIGNKFIGATRGKDDVTITARRGEMMLNADQQKRLYDIANGGTTVNLTASLVEALQAMPAPVLVYSEFKRFTDRVATLDDAAKLH